MENVESQSTLKNLGDILKSPDVMLAMSLMGILFTMILPLPPFLLDILLSMSIAYLF